jgi:hypothetical protein
MAENSMESITQNPTRTRVNHFLEDFLNPKSICIFGANENLLQNMASQQLLNAFDDGYAG